MHTSNILRTDSYKTSHWLQYPPGTEQVYSYLESRGGEFPETAFFGLNYYLKNYLANPITKDDIDYAEDRITKHMGPGIFNRAGWERIVNVHGGYVPVRIRAVPEGTVVPVRNVLMSIENTDSQIPWITNYVETMLLKVWYPTTVATLSRHIKQIIAQFKRETSDDMNGLDFMLHDFGYRGVSSEESALIGGMAHLVSFKGTDTMLALEGATEFYGEDMAGYSVPAAEHSTVCLWGEENEVDAYENMIKKFGHGGIYSVVSDSYDIYRACDELWGKQLRNKVMNAHATLVVRPDSGTPHEVVRRVIETLDVNYGHTINNRGFKVLNKVRVIQGDGIDAEEITRILTTLKVRGWSADNVVFGMGGALLQKCNRDTNRFAIKASSAVVNGRIRDVYKRPITDNEKRSKQGRLKLVRTISSTDDMTFETVQTTDIGHDCMVDVWNAGNLLVTPSFTDIRTRASI